MPPSSSRGSSRSPSRSLTPGLRLLPVPGALGWRWTVQRDRVWERLRSLGFRTAVAFFIFGLMNNILYVIVLSVCTSEIMLMVGCFGFGWAYCAQGSSTARGRVACLSIQSSCALLFPCRTLSVCSSFRIDFSIRIILFIGLSFLGMQLVAQTTGLTPRLIGIVVASISSGAGELSFLQLTHWHENTALPGFAVGTGMAGLAGAYLYLALTTWIGLSVRTSLNVSSVHLVIRLIVVSSIFAGRGILSYPTLTDKVFGKLRIPSDSKR
jgi:battenin